MSRYSEPPDLFWQMGVLRAAVLQKDAAFHSSLIGRIPMRFAVGDNDPIFAQEQHRLIKSCVFRNSTSHASYILLALYGRMCYHARQNRLLCSHHVRRAFTKPIRLHEPERWKIYGQKSETLA